MHLLSLSSVSLARDYGFSLTIEVATWTIATHMSCRLLGHIFLRLSVVHLIVLEVFCQARHDIGMSLVDS